ncbi:uncharacterized protein [Ptychodera flava]|uniref:uncharacterized protein n=1 Tax=Ptychodera flava TaxID=63121 RepID=UPI003969E50E
MMSGHFKKVDGRKIVFLVGFLCSGLSSVNCILPDYTPAVNAQADESAYRESLIQAYFSACYSNEEILAALAISHGVILSLRHLKRLLQKYGLKRRQCLGTASNLQQVVATIQSEIQGSGKCLGYRAMWKRLKIKYGLRVNRDTVLHLLNILDPDGIQRRKKHRLLRRKYVSPGPNFIWHVDGYDKLKPFGFAIHGAVDGFSRRILWLEVATSNNNPHIIANYFLDYVKQIGFVPRVLRCDRGTENSALEYLQPYFRWNDSDDLAGINSFMYGKSTSNQRIEAWWSNMRKQGADWWINYFKDLRDSGLFHDHDPIHVECLRFCYMGVLQQELHDIAVEWNLHFITSKRNAENVRGKPDVLYFLPSIYNTRDYGKQSRQK